MKLQSLKFLPLSLLFASLVLLSSPADAVFEWPVATPQEVNVDSQALAEVSGRINQGQYGAINSFLVLRHGKLVHEEYFNGFGPDDLMELFSVTKSVASALVGVAQRRGDLPPLNTRFETLFPSYTGLLNVNPLARQITFRDLLTQRHGFEWDEWSTSWSNPINPAWQMMNAPDWWGSVLIRPVTAAPDTVFRYSTGVSNLMGLAFWEHTGMSAADYALQHLFPQLEITNANIAVTGPGAPLNAGLGIFQQGLTPTGHGLWLSARDLAKVGQLYLDGGVFQNRRLIEKQWIEDSWGHYSDHVTDPQVFGEGISYGYQWWTVDVQGPSGPVEVHRAWGYGGQFIFVIPEFDMVVVTTASNWNRDGEDMRHAFSDVIVNAVGEDFDPLSDAGITGPWVAPGLPSQGFMLEVMPTTGQVVLYWMTYDPDTGEQMWLIAPSHLRGRRALLSFLKPVAGSFHDDTAANLVPWGEGELIFTSCTTAQLSFRSELHDIEGAFGMHRLTPNVYCSDD
jgi:CubicO group peptidase (beta-lactamase class C family)